MATDRYPGTRLTRERAAVLFIDHQVGLLLGIHDHDQEELRRNAIGLAKAVTAYRLPAVITTSADDGPNGELLPQLAAALPGVPVIRRPGEIDASSGCSYASSRAIFGRRVLFMVISFASYQGQTDRMIAGLDSYLLWGGSFPAPRRSGLA